MSFKKPIEIYRFLFKKRKTQTLKDEITKILVISCIIYDNNMEVEVITFQIWRKLQLDKRDVVVTVSKSNDWSKGLSPFVLGPCKLYGDYVAKNMENSWQFAKVYPEHIEGGEIAPSYFEWAKKGWEDSRAHRYPMGKGAIPEFSYWDGEKLSYVEARKKIYIPLYYKAVKETFAFARLRDIYEEQKAEGRNLYLIDFDAYRHKSMGMSYKDVIHCAERKMGHAFVLAMALEIPEKLEKAVNK